MTWEEAEIAIKQGLDKTIERSMHNLKNNLQLEWPVDTGRSKEGFDVVQSQNPIPHTQGWAVVNYVVNPDTKESYIPDLWKGLPWGSKQLPFGADPIFDTWFYKFQDNLKNTTF